LYCLNYFKVKTEGENIIIEYYKIDKASSNDLTLVQRIMSRAQIATANTIPAKTIIKMEGESNKK
jgi:hypothetical protein